MSRELLGELMKPLPLQQIAASLRATILLFGLRITTVSRQYGALFRTLLFD